MVSVDLVVIDHRAGAGRGQVVVIILPADVDARHDVESAAAIDVLFERDTAAAATAKVIAGRQVVDLVEADICPG